MSVAKHMFYIAIVSLLIALFTIPVFGMKKNKNQKLPHIKKMKKRKRSENLMKLMKENKEQREKTYTRVFPPLTNKKEN